MNEGGWREEEGGRKGERERRGGKECGQKCRIPTTEALSLGNLPTSRCTLSKKRDIIIRRETKRAKEGGRKEAREGGMEEG